jgi:23S rRNA pseudouridine1911/1915/1917 synthase
MINEEIIETQDERDELYEHYRIVADQGQSLLRVDKFLMNRLENTSRNKIQNTAKAGNVLVNDKPVKPNHKVHPGDVVSLVMTHPPRDIEIIPENIPLEVVFEDEHLIIINKKPGMVVHPAYGNYTGTLVNALTYYFSDQKNSEGEVPKPCLVHRIDKDTSGIMIVAKTELAQTRLANDFFHHTIDRKYQALAWGDFVEDSGTIIGNVGRSLKDRKVMTVFPEGDYGKHAITHWRVIERLGYVTLIECTLETGRTHQIRAHMRYVKHPLFNDETYGGDKIIKGTTFNKYKQFVNNCFKLIPRQALHAKSLGITHPITQEKLFFDSELPEDMATAIDKWRHYAKHKELEEDVEKIMDI